MRRSVDLTYEVRLLGVPVATHLRSQEHRAEIVREMYLIAQRQVAGTHLPLQLVQESAAAPHVPDHGVPQRLTDSIEALTSQLAVLASHDDQLADAIEHEIDTIDIVYLVPGFIADAAQAFIEVLDEVDDFSRRGTHLLTLATPPELVRYRRWYFGQFATQIAGGKPTPWSAAH